MPNVLTVRGLKKSYGQKTALAGIDFDVRAGEVFALIGPNGAGKTTTLRIIATLLTATEGETRFLDRDHRKEPDFVRERISYLPDEAGAYKDMKGLDYLRFMANFYARTPEEEKEFVDRVVAIAARRESGEPSELADRLERDLLDLSGTQVRHPPLSGRRLHGPLHGQNGRNRAVPAHY